MERALKKLENLKSENSKSIVLDGESIKKLEKLARVKFPRAA